MECFWPKFLKYRDNCADPKYEYKDVPPLCDPSMWYLEKMTDPILSGTNYHRFVSGIFLYWIEHIFRCGPAYGHARCSVIESDWKIQKPANGPCCSAGHYCGTTDDHCLCADCVDFRTIVESKFISFNLFPASEIPFSKLINSKFLVPGWSFKNGHFLSGLISEDRTAYKDLTEAMKSCKKYGSCKGVTHDVRRKVYELRAGKQFIKSSTGERSWLKV